MAIPPVSREGGRAGLPKEGKWPPRGTETTVLTFSCPSQPCFGGSKGCARVTGQAGENGQNSGEMGGSSPWTRPSAPGCGDTLKDWRATSVRSSVGIVLEDGSGVGSTYCQANVRVGKCAAAPYPSVAVRDRGH